MKKAQSFDGVVMFIWMPFFGENSRKVAKTLGFKNKAHPGF
jgi:hypothetical protein